MKFTIEKKAFAAALSRVSRVVEHRNTYPILANVVIEAKEGGISLRATDLDIQIAEPVAALVSEHGITTVPAKMISEIVRKMPDGSEIVFEEKEGQATVKAGRSRFNLQCLDAESFPTIEPGQFRSSFVLASKDFARIIGKVSFAISAEETRYYLNGIYLHTTEVDGSWVLRGVATDGHRLARCEIEAPDGSTDMPGVIIPKKTVGEIAKLIDGADEVAVDVSDTKIRLTIGGVVLVSKLIEGTFPDYERVTPQITNTIAAVDIGALKSALDRVSIVATDRGGKAVKLAFTSGQVALEVSNPDHGAATEDLAADWEADPMAIGFNVRYAVDCLSAIDGDTVMISITDENSPTRLFSAADPSTVVVLMPMRV